MFLMSLSGSAGQGQDHQGGSLDWAGASFFFIIFLIYFLGGDFFQIFSLYLPALFPGSWRRSPQSTCQKSLHSDASYRETYKNMCNIHIIFKNENRIKCRNKMCIKNEMQLETEPSKYLPEVSAEKLSGKNI